MNHVAVGANDNEDVTFYQSTNSKEFAHLNIDFLSSGSLRLPKEHLTKHPHISFENKI